MPTVGFKAYAGFARQTLDTTAQASMDALLADPSPEDRDDEALDPMAVWDLWEAYMEDWEDFRSVAYAR